MPNVACELRIALALTMLPDAKRPKAPVHISEAHPPKNELLRDDLRPSEDVG